VNLPTFPDKELLYEWLPVGYDWSDSKYEAAQVGGNITAVAVSPEVMQ